MKRMDTVVSNKLAPDFGVSNQFSQKMKRIKNNVWNDFVSNSTVHGFHFLFEGRPILQRLIWFLLLIVMICLYVWQSSILIMAYFEYKVTSRIRIVNERQSVFPAVTICNFNQYRMNALNQSRFKEIVEANNPLYKKNSKPLDWEKYSDEVKSINMEDTIRSVGHQLKYDHATTRGMLYRCVWKGQDCSDVNFTTVLTDMGVCYTFNSGKTAEPMNVSSPGNSFGLKLTMSVEQEEYIGHDTFSAGLKVRVHDQNEPPLVGSLGFAAMPGSHVFAVISRTRIISMKHPYETMCDDRKLHNVKEYTKAACYNTCKDDFVTKHCQCRPYYMRDIRFPLCNIKEYFTCVIEKEKIFSSMSLEDCNCPEPCDFMKYNTYLSYGKFPSWESNKLYTNHDEKLMDRYSRNVLRLYIYYEDLCYNVLEQIPRYNIENLLGELGGLLGLYLGASVLTLVEFFDVALATIVAHFGFYKRNIS